MKFLPAAARDSEMGATALNKLAAQIAALASTRDLILVGPLFRHEEHWWRVLAFASRDAAMMTTAAILGDEIPTLADTATLTAALRTHFGSVQIFSNPIEMAREAARVWPCERSSRFLEIVRRGDAGSPIVDLNS